MHRCCFMPHPHSPLTRFRSESVGDADQYFRPFALALETKSSKMRAMALDSIEKMIGAARCHASIVRARARR